MAFSAASIIPWWVAIVPSAVRAEHLEVAERLANAETFYDRRRSGDAVLCYSELSGHRILAYTPLKRTMS